MLQDYIIRNIFVVSLMFLVLDEIWQMNISTHDIIYNNSATYDTDSFSAIYNHNEESS